MLAYLPQHLSELGTVALAVAIAVRAVPTLITGRMGSLPDRNRGFWTSGRVRAMAVISLLLAAGVAIAGFVIPAEPSGGFRNHWGTRADRTAEAVWLVFLAAITGYGLWRDRRG
jgi:hypothetical protein